MFDWFNKDKRANNVYEFPTQYPEIPKIQPPAPRKPQEHYRVGFNDEGSTTLTLLGNDGASMTLTMNRTACEQLIGMLRATYLDEDEDEDHGS
jgi:hypothetical protein